MTSSRQNLANGDGKRLFYSGLASLMKEILRQSTMVDLPDVLPAVVQLAEAFSYSVKTGRFSQVKPCDICTVVSLRLPFLPYV